MDSELGGIELVLFWLDFESTISVHAKAKQRVPKESRI